MITSTSNEKIKYIKKLRNNKNIYEEKKFIIEGEHLIIEAKKSGILLETLSINDVSFGVTNTLVSENVMKSISALNTICPVVGICKIEEKTIEYGNKIIILDGVSDPGNLGTIIRSANAFGFNDIILSKSCVNKYNDKVLRATQGMIFSMNVVTKDLTEFIPYLKENGYSVYGTDVINGTNVCDVKYDKIAVVLGSEGLGLSNEVKELIDKNIYINMNETCESLNVAVASSIIMYELNK